MSDYTISVKQIRKLRLARRLVPFIGAGLGKNLGLPDWGDLTELLAAELDLSPREFDLKGDFLQLAEYYQIVKGDLQEFRRKMRRFLHPPDEAILDSDIYSNLVALNFPTIYTTNFDDIIERAFALRSRPCHAISDMQDLIDAPLDVTHVVKIHGTYNTDSALVLTESQFFDRMEFESAIDIKFKHDLLSHAFLFLGYSFRDINIRYRIYEMMKYKRQVCHGLAECPTAIFVDFNIGPVRRRVLANRGIPVVELADDDRGARVAEFLAALR